MNCLGCFRWRKADLGPADSSPKPVMSDRVLAAAIRSGKLQLGRPEHLEASQALEAVFISLHATPTTIDAVIVAVRYWRWRALVKRSPERTEIGDVNTAARSLPASNLIAKRAARSQLLLSRHRGTVRGAADRTRYGCVLLRSIGARCRSERAMARALIATWRHSCVSELAAPVDQHIALELRELEFAHRSALFMATVTLVTVMVRYTASRLTQLSCSVVQRWRATVRQHGSNHSIQTVVSVLRWRRAARIEQRGAVERGTALLQAFHWSTAADTKMLLMCVLIQLRHNVAEIRDQVRGGSAAVMGFSILADAGAAKSIRPD